MCRVNSYSFLRFTDYSGHLSIFRKSHFQLRKLKAGKLSGNKLRELRRNTLFLHKFQIHYSLWALNILLFWTVIWTSLNKLLANGCYLLFFNTIFWFLEPMTVSYILHSPLPHPYLQCLGLNQTSCRYSMPAWMQPVIFHSYSHIHSAKSKTWLSAAQRKWCSRSQIQTLIQSFQ